MNLRSVNRVKLFSKSHRYLYIQVYYPLLYMCAQFHFEKQLYLSETASHPKNFSTLISCVLYAATAKLFVCEIQVVILTGQIK